MWYFVYIQQFIWHVLIFKSGMFTWQIRNKLLWGFYKSQKVKTQTYTYMDKIAGTLLLMTEN